MAQRTKKAVKAEVGTVDVWQGRPKRTKFALVGFTQHRALAPYNDESWEIWGLNDLYFELPESVNRNRLRWFQIHGWVETAPHAQEPVTAHPLNFAGGPPHPRDPNHVPWLKQTAEQIPVYILEPRQEVPNGIVYPKEQVFAYFSLNGTDPCTYFTNSISWMLALAIMELVPTPGGRCVEGAEIGVWGVDMMMSGGKGSEYGYQRPSCEWLLGWARAAGIRVTVPDESDLLKTAFTYGDHKASVYRTKLMNHKAELVQRLNAVQQQRAQMDHGIAELSGALNVLNWQLDSWMPQDSNDPSIGKAPMPDAHKIAPPTAASA